MNINRVVLTGNLTAEPELRRFESGNAVCRLRVACNTRRRQQDGSWAEKPNYFDVAVWGPQGESASRFLAKGSAVAVDGRLEWREWSSQSGEKRQAVEIIAENVQFLDTRRREDSPQVSAPADTDPAPVDDIPF